MIRDKDADADAARKVIELGKSLEPTSPVAAGLLYAVAGCLLDGSALELLEHLTPFTEARLAVGREFISAAVRRN